MAHMNYYYVKKLLREKIFPMLKMKKFSMYFRSTTQMKQKLELVNNSILGHVVHLKFNHV